MKKSLLLASLIAAVALAACGKKEGAAVEAASEDASEVAVVADAAAEAASAAVDAASAAVDAASAVVEAASEVASAVN